MNPRRLLPGLLLGLTGLAWTIAAPPPFTEAQAPKRGGTLRVAYGNEISNFDYHVAPGYELVWAVQNTYLSASTAGWNSTRHTDPKVDEYYARYAREMDPAKRKTIAKEFQEFSADKLYWNTISGSPFYQAAQPWMRDYVYQAEFKVLYKKVWLDK